MSKQLFTTLLIAALAFSALADPAKFQQAVERGKVLIEEEKYSEALQQLQQAAAEDSSRHESYFYLAMASYRTGDLKAAEEFARSALAKAPEAEKKTVQEMISVIEEKRDFSKYVAEGDEAFRNGLLAKAAESYRKAYLLFPAQGEIGLKAAAIFSERFKRLLEAAALWQKVTASADQASAATAREKLRAHGSQMEELIRAELRKEPDADRWQLLSEACPPSADLHVKLATLYPGSELTNILHHLGQANRLGIKAGAICSENKFIILLQSTDTGLQFAEFVSNAFGPDVLECLKEAVADREEETKAEEPNAANAYRAALQKLSRSKSPEQWARTQFWLGYSLNEKARKFDLKHPDRRSVVDEAIVAFRAALEVYSLSHNPRAWAKAQVELGSALLSRFYAFKDNGEEQARCLRGAIAAYRAALKVYTVEEWPKEWIKMQENLAERFARLAELRHGEKRVDLYTEEEQQAFFAEAVSALRAILKVFPREQKPSKWSDYKVDVGMILSRQADRAKGSTAAELRTEAISAFKDALEETDTFSSDYLDLIHSMIAEEEKALRELQR